MQDFSTVAELPNAPAVYALYAGDGQSEYVVYVGYTKKLKTRIGQHLVARDSSINTATAAARLNPDRITHVRWWTSAEFERDGKPDVPRLRAAELIAFRALDPVLRSHGHADQEARHLLDQDQEFKRTMEALFEKGPDGCLRRRESFILILTEIDDLRKRVDSLEARLGSSSAAGL
jgi:hypothetical protein